jgi:hypothetical protein
MAPHEGLAGSRIGAPNDLIRMDEVDAPEPASGAVQVPEESDRLLRRRSAGDLCPTESETVSPREHART